MRERVVSGDEKKTATLAFRLSPNERRLVKVAAAAQDRTMSSLARESAVTAARNVLEEHGLRSLVEEEDEGGE